MGTATTPMVQCDQCAEEFEIDLKEHPIMGGIERGFRCPHCQKWYRVALITQRGVRIREAIQEISSELALRPDDTSLADRLATLRKEMAKEVRGV